MLGQIVISAIIIGIISVALWTVYQKLKKDVKDIQEQLNNDNKDSAKEIEFLEKLQQVDALVRSIEKDRERKFGEINSTIVSAKEIINKVGGEVHNLSLALSNSATRGQFGEKLAEDILTKLGFIEGINYLKQNETPDGTRPDFTFILPNEIQCNMDSKFPLSNYLKYLDAKEEDMRKAYLTKFLKDVKDRIKEINGIGYINEKTTDFVLIFIPNTGVFDFILQNDYEIIDYAFDNKVILCSPFTLYLVLRVFFQVNHLFNLDKKVVQAVAKLDKFYLEWHKIKEEERKFDDKLEKLNEARAAIRGTRTRVLEKAIEDMRG